MAKLRMHIEILEDMVFGYAVEPVHLEGVSFDEVTGDVTLEISGPGVPEAPEVVAIVTYQRNRARQELVTISFMVADPQVWRRDPLKLGADPA